MYGSLRVLLEKVSKGYITGVCVCACVIVTVYMCIWIWIS